MTIQFSHENSFLAGHAPPDSLSIFEKTASADTEKTLRAESPPRITFRARLLSLLTYAYLSQAPGFATGDIK